MTSWMDNPQVSDELSQKFPDWRPPGVTGVPVREYVAPVNGAGPELTGREERYAHAALESQCADLAAMGKDSGRNQFLNDSAFKMCQYVSSGWLTQREVVDALLDACRINGLRAEDGDAQCLKTIYSGLRGGGRLGARDVDWLNSEVPFTVTEGIEGYGAGTVPGFNQAPAPVANGHTTNAAATGRLINWTTAASVRDGVPTWGWHYEGKGRIQLGTLSLFAGRPGAGKSTAARWLVAEATRGQLGGHFYGRPQNVAYIGTEEPEKYTIVPSLRAANADLDRVHFPHAFVGEQQTIIMSSLDEQNIGQYCFDNDIRIVIVDALMTTVGSNTDINKNNEVRAMITPWQRIAEAIDGMVIGVVHLRKSTSNDVVAAINGSSAFGEVARSIFAFAKHPDTDQRIMSQHKNSTGFEDLSVFYELQTTTVLVSTGEAAEVAKFTITGKADMTVEDVFTDAMQNTGSTAEATMWLEDYLRINGPHVKSQEAKKDGKNAGGYSERTVQRAAQKLRVVAVSRDFPRCTYWTLPETASGASMSRPDEPIRGLDD